MQLFFSNHYQSLISLTILISLWNDKENFFKYIYNTQKSNDKKSNLSFFAKCSYEVFLYLINLLPAKA